ncbi:unnamed protein product [Rotaria sp. Silwood2]|nr:unnamed protein product [Rotaria sp. Silwood2]CAF4433730.1 unnamed protein product [Rotaria sp. Silwood2]
MATKRSVSNSEDENDLHSLTERDENICLIKINQSDQTPGGTKRRRKNVNGAHESLSQLCLVFIGKEQIQKENFLDDVERQKELNQQQKQKDEINKKISFKIETKSRAITTKCAIFVPSECRQQGEPIMKMMFNRSHIAKNSTCNQPYIYNPEAWSSLPQPKVKMPYGHETQTYITNNNMNNLQMLDEIKRTSNECERLKLEMEKQDAEAKEKIEQQNKQFQQILVVATQLIQQQANMLEQFTKVVNETLAVVQTAVNNNDGLKSGGSQKKSYFLTY